MKGSTIKIFDFLLHFPINLNLKKASLNNKEAVPNLSFLKNKVSLIDSTVEHFIFDVLKLIFRQVVENEVIFQTWKN